MRLNLTSLLLATTASFTLSFLLPSSTLSPRRWGYSYHPSNRQHHTYVSRGRGTTHNLFLDSHITVAAIDSSASHGIVYFANKLASNALPFLTFLFFFGGLLFALVASNSRLFSEINQAASSSSSINPGDELPLSWLYDPLGGPVSKTEVFSLLSSLKVPSDIGDFDKYRSEMLARGRDITVPGSMQWVLREDFVRSKKTKVGERAANLVFDMWSRGSNTAEYDKVQRVIAGVRDSDGNVSDDRVVRAAVEGRLFGRGAGIFCFVVVQAVLVKSFFVPALVQFFEL